jgi:polyisoprenoid-binding protein YceI
LQQGITLPRVEGRRISTRGALLLCAGARLLAHEGEGHFSAGEPGDPKKPFRVVEITMQETNGTMSYRPKALERRGEQITLRVESSSTDNPRLRGALPSADLAEVKEGARVLVTSRPVRTKTNAPRVKSSS